MVRKAVFLDRDGVLNIPIIKDGKSFAPRKFKNFKIYPSVKKYCSLLKKKNFKLVVVTNQPDLGDGTIKKSEFKKMSDKLINYLGIDEINVALSRSPKSLLKKPNSGMLLRSIKKNNFDVKKCFLIGDRWSDIQAASNIGCKSIFIDRKYKEPMPNQQIATVRSFNRAVEIILKKYNNKLIKK